MEVPTPSPVVSFPAPQSLDEAVNVAANLWGIQHEFWDIFGQRHTASQQAKQAILNSLGVAAQSLLSLGEAIEARVHEEWSRLVPVTAVILREEPAVPVHLPADSPPSRLQLTFRWENGDVQELKHTIESLRVEKEARVRDTLFRRYLCPIPADAPLGYHSLTVRAGQDVANCHLIVCPSSAYKPAFLERGGKAAGLGISLYGLRSERNWGCGDFTDLEQLADWVAADLGGSLIGLNPLHAIPNRQPYNTSPYLPNCTYFRNGLYLDIERVEDFRRSTWSGKILAGERVQNTIEELRASTYVEYEKVWSLKLRFLKLAWREFQRSADSERRSAFETYAQKHGKLLDLYATYCALDEVLHKRDPNMWIWPDWPEKYRVPASPDVAEFAASHRRLILFYKYIQWQVDLQLSAAQAYTRKLGMPVGLYHDLALATDRCGSDLWAQRDFYVAGCRVGSPPDDFSPKGQDWAFPPPDSHRHRADGYRLFAESIRRNSSHGGALRIDHVMRFFRLFWIPDGAEAANGVYISDNSEDLLRILALESVRNEVMIVGEDLGTVEPYIREALVRYGILSYRLLYFEKNADGSFRTPEQYPEQALVSVSTHDLPTLAGFWTNRDIEARRRAGVLPDDESYRQQLRSRAQDKQRLLDAFFSQHLLPNAFPRLASDIGEFTGELHNAAVGFLAKTRSNVMLLNGEDLFKQADQQNLPGTTAEYPNWRGKLRWTLEELRTEKGARDCTAMFRNWLARTGRIFQAADRS